jgi:hypothetical protein
VARYFCRGFILCTPLWYIHTNAYLKHTGSVLKCSNALSLFIVEESDWRFL